MGNCYRSGIRSHQSSSGIAYGAVPQCASRVRLDPAQSLAPGPVQNLTVTVDPTLPSVALKWEPPANVGDLNGRIAKYEIHFSECGPDMNNTLYVYATLHTGGQQFNSNDSRRRYVNARNTHIYLTQESGLIPLTRFKFKVRALMEIRPFEGEWSARGVFIDWNCQLPNCTHNRLKRFDGSIYTFCSKEHARKFASNYCLLPNCGTPTPFDFCSEGHEQEAERNDLIFTVEVSPTSREFGEQCKRFHRDWDKKKGSCPAVELGILLRVVHPLVSKRLERYIQKLPSGCRKIEHYYHGTRLNCSIEKYLETCLSSECHVCGVTRKSFDASRIDRLAFQRLGPGFYLAPNSSKAHDYTNHSATGFRGIILCDVAPGKKYVTRYGDTTLCRPPDGYHSVYGKHKLMGKFGELNYDEIVIFTADAICPRYVFVYKHESPDQHV